MRAFGHDLRRVVLAVVAAAAVVALSAAPARAQLDSWGYWENGVTEAWWLSSADFESAEAAASFERWRAVGADARAASGNPWAGDYFAGGETHGTYLRWSPQGGFVLAHVDKCQARVMGVTYGRAEFTPSLVRFVPEFSKSAAHAHGRADAAQAAAPAELRFVPVVWGGERLLVAEDGLEDFGDHLAGLGRYNDWDEFLSLEYTNYLTQRSEPQVVTPDEDGGLGALRAARRAPPVLPPGYERFLKEPIRATVIAVGRTRDARDYTDEGPNRSATYERARLTFVTLDRGREHGVVDRMAFRFADAGEVGGVRVLRAGARTSSAVVVGSLDEDGPAARRRRPLAGVGDKLTTSPF